MRSKGYRTIEERLRRWKEDEHGCHIWQGRRADGYAVIGYLGKSNYPVHRLRHEREIGPVPEGARIRFSCGHGPDGCCNPRHIAFTFPGKPGRFRTPRSAPRA